MRHTESRYALLALATLLALTALGGCATVPPPPFAPVDTPPDTVRSEPSTLMPTGRRIPTPVPTAVVPRSYAPADSLPSAEALALLDSIPEPLAPGERIRPRRRPAIAAIVDSSAISREPAAAPADSSSEQGHADAPVPSPTQPLGDRPGALQRMLAADSAATADSSARARGSSGASARPRGGASSAPAGSAPDTCFRVQVGAPAEVARANQLRDAAASQLLVPMVIEKESGLFKVRTRDCYTRESADRLRARAVGAGFKGVFRISGPRPGPGR